jgi:hypothetical protein
MSQLPRVETVADPGAYSPGQLDVALRVAVLLGRGLLVLCETPRR